MTVEIISDAFHDAIVSSLQHFIYVIFIDILTIKILLVGNFLTINRQQRSCIILTSAILHV